VFVVEVFVSDARQANSATINDGSPAILRVFIPLSPARHPQLVVLTVVVEA
jgi:hypothetical protein